MFDWVYSELDEADQELLEDLENSDGQLRIRMTDPDAFTLGENERAVSFAEQALEVAAGALDDYAIGDALRVR